MLMASAARCRATSIRHRRARILRGRFARAAAAAHRRRDPARPDPERGRRQRLQARVPQPSARPDRRLPAAHGRWHPHRGARRWRRALPRPRDAREPAPGHPPDPAARGPDQGRHLLAVAGRHDLRAGSAPAPRGGCYALSRAVANAEARPAATNAQRRRVGAGRHWGADAEASSPCRTPRPRSDPLSFLKAPRRVALRSRGGACGAGPARRCGAIPAGRSEGGGLRSRTGNRPPPGSPCRRVRSASPHPSCRR